MVDRVAILYPVHFIIYLRCLPPFRGFPCWRSVLRFWRFDLHSVTFWRICGVKPKIVVQAIPTSK